MSEQYFYQGEPVGDLFRGSMEFNDWRAALSLRFPNAHTLPTTSDEDHVIENERHEILAFWWFNEDDNYWMGVVYHEPRVWRE